MSNGTPTWTPSCWKNLTVVGSYTLRSKFDAVRYGPRSVHWPRNEPSPPMPFGPTMSGGFGPSWVDRAATAESYAVTANFRLLPGYFCAKPSATAFSLGCCSGAAPVPRQQNQRRAAGSKSGTLNVWCGAAVGAWVAEVVGAFVGAVVGVAELQAEATI